MISNFFKFSELRVSVIPQFQKTTPSNVQNLSHIVLLRIRGKWNVAKFSDV